jgi:putative transport protein
MTECGRRGAAPRGQGDLAGVGMHSSSGIVEFLRGQPVLVLFVLLGLGHLLGRIKVAGFAFGPVAGVLLVAIVLGSFGFRISPGAQAVGFALFIFAVGYQAGPRFIEVLKAQGLQYFTLAVFVVGVGSTTAWLAGRLLRLPLGGTAGLLAGSLTSSPSLAAAQDAVRSGLVSLPPGWTPESALASIDTSYAITYVVGTLGIVALVSLFPRMIGLDLESEARRLEQLVEQDAVEPLQARAYRVENEDFCRPTLAQLAERFWDGLAVVRIRRATLWLEQHSQEHLRIGDELYAYGYARFFRGGIDCAGPEIPILSETELSASQRHVVIARRGAVGQTLHALNLARHYGLVVCAVRRDGYTLPVVRDLVLQRGDVLTVVGPMWGIKALPEILGPVEANPVETDMMTFVFGVALGAALGLLSTTVGGIPLTLGMAGGLLLVGILVGWINSARPTVGRFPNAARWVLMEFGLLIFIAGVGLNAGSGILDTLRHSGIGLILAAALVVALPLGLGYVFGRKILKLEPVLLLGALTGAMTSGPALSLVTREAQSPVPALGYTGTYALASILLTVAGTVMMHL